MLIRRSHKFFEPARKSGDISQTQIQILVSDFFLSGSSKPVSSRKKNALILHGPPGVGKTTLAYVASKESNSEIFELNASDFRDKKKLEEILGE